MDELLKSILPIVQLVAFDLIILAALLCLAMWIYTFIVNKWPKIRGRYKRDEEIAVENDVLKEMGKSRDQVREDIYRKENLDAVLAATSKDLSEYLSEIYQQQINANDIHIHTIIKKKWTDSTLNCPNSSTETTPPILEETEGWLLVWKYRETLEKVRLFQYHTTINGEWVRCGEVDVAK